MQPPENVLFNFQEPAAATRWFPINDGVMGGLSTSEVVPEPGYAAFRGTVSLEYGGGFASVRSRPELVDLASCAGIALFVGGDGKRYKFNVKNEPTFDGVLYQSSFDTASGNWQVVRLPFADFRPSYRGRPVPGAPPLDPSAIRSFGLMISERQAGPFRLELSWIAGY